MPALYVTLNGFLGRGHKVFKCSHSLTLNMGGTFHTELMNLFLTRHFYPSVKFALKITLDLKSLIGHLSDSL